MVNISDLQNQFQYIVNSATQKNLVILNNNYQNIDINNTVSKFINSIFYDSFILPLLNSIGNEYNKKYYSYLKNSLIRFIIPKLPKQSYRDMCGYFPAHSYLLYPDSR